MKEQKRINNDLKNKLIVIFFIFLLVLNFTQISDEVANDYIEETLESAAKAYVIGRAINGTISVLQDIELSAVVISVSPGEILDPVNDLIEQFSSVMLVTTASLAIQKIILEISNWYVIKIFILFFLILLIIHFGLKNRKNEIINRKIMLIMYKCLVLLLILRFSVPFMIIASGIIEKIFINDKIMTSISSLEEINDSAKNIAKNKSVAHKKNDEVNDSKINKEVLKSSRKNSPEILDPSFSGFVDDVLNKVTDSVNTATTKITTETNKITNSITYKKVTLENKVSEIEEIFSESVKHIIDLVSLFIVNTVILPVFFLYITFHIGKGIFHYKF